MNQLAQPYDRREMLRTMARWSTLALVASGTAGLLWRTARTDARAGCPQLGNCDDCGAFNQCPQAPAALARKRYAR